MKLREVKTPCVAILDIGKPRGRFLSEDELEAKPGEEAGQLADAIASRNAYGYPLRGQGNLGGTYLRECRDYRLF